MKREEKILDKVGNYVIPLSTLLIIIFGLIRKVPIFDAFLQGSKDGMRSTAGIAPALIGLITAVTMLKASGALDIFTSLIKPVTDAIGFPSELVPLAILRPISGSGSIALLDNIMKNHGVDTFIGRVGSVMMGSTETTFYAVAVYFGAIGIKNTKHAIPSSLIADILAVITSIFAVIIMFGAN